MKYFIDDPAVIRMAARMYNRFVAIAIDEGMTDEKASKNITPSIVVFIPEYATSIENVDPNYVIECAAIAYAKSDEYMTKFNNVADAFITKIAKDCGCSRDEVMKEVDEFSNKILDAAIEILGKDIRDMLCKMLA